MIGLEHEREFKQTFNNSTYYVRALRKDNTLYIEVEQEDTGYEWKNQFANSYIEEMTTKTGNFKTFDKFCKMIYCALQLNDNGSVFIDLLTYQDLEILKARKTSKSSIEPQSLNVTQRTKNKRYLILTYVVEFDRVHYPLALKFDENSMNNNRCATDTARKLLSHSSSNTSISTSSPNLNKIRAQQQNINYINYKASHSTPNLNNNNVSSNTNTNKLNEILEENIKLKILLKQQRQHNNNNNNNNNNNTNKYPSEKLSNIIEILEDEIKILKKELEKKNLEMKRITKNTTHFQQKNISKRLDDLEDEIERLSTELLSERTKCRRISREFHSDKIDLNKKIEMLQASNQHYKNKCKSLKNELNLTKETLNNLRIKASKQRLYSSKKSFKRNNNNNNNNNVSERHKIQLRRSRSRNNNNKYYPKRKKKSNTKTHTNIYKSQRMKSKNKNNKNNKYYRSSSAPRFQSRSKSPSIRFDPTEWAKNRKAKIEKAKLLKNTFGNSRSPSPFRTSRSVSPINAPKYGNKKRRNILKKRDRSNSRKRNSFGTTISISPKTNKHKNKQRLPLHPKSNYLLSTRINKTQKRTLSINNNDSLLNYQESDDDDDDDESTFNPTKEIESIDSRLNALQKFLRAAKSSS